MTDSITIILSEYQALRAELMMFLETQRRNMTFLVTASLGQTGFLFLSLDKTSAEALVFVYMYLIPFLIFIIMVRALENTSKIILTADYIHKGIKTQLKSVVNCDCDFFEWEEHKARTTRINKKTLFILDLSKWSIFIVGLVLSFIAALWLSSSLDNNPLSWYHYVSGVVMNVLWAVICITFSYTFNEVQGETRYP